VAKFPADPVRCGDNPPVDLVAAAGKADAAAAADVAVAAAVAAEDRQPGAESMSSHSPRSQHIHKCHNC
jgi:hypothetical protein